MEPGLRFSREGCNQEVSSALEKRVVLTVVGEDRAFWDPATDSPPTRLRQRGVYTTPGSRPGLNAVAATPLYKEDL